MIFFKRRNRERPETPIVVVPGPLDPATRATLMQEYDLLHALGDTRDAAQQQRYSSLHRTLWPEWQHPHTGAFRVRGGHGFPVYTDPARPGGYIP